MLAGLVHSALGRPVPRSAVTLECPSARDGRRSTPARRGVRRSRLESSDLPADASHLNRNGIATPDGQSRCAPPAPAPGAPVVNKRMIQMLAIVILVIATLGFVKFQQISAAMAGNKSFAMPPEAVTTVIAARSDWATTLDAVGSIAPVQGVTLGADLPGVVDGIGFVSGTHVDKDQVLLRLDTRQEAAQLASAEAGLELG